MAQRKQLGFRASAAMYQRLVEESQKTGAPIQRIIEKALEAYLPPKAKRRA